jgi:hypothetical protein
MAVGAPFSPHRHLHTAWRTLRDVVAESWYLGFTSFGGPPVHFKIVRLCALPSPIPPPPIAPEERREADADINHSYTINSSQN